MSTLLLTMEPAEKIESSEHVKPHLPYYVTIGMPIEVIIAIIGNNSFMVN